MNARVDRFVEPSNVAPFRRSRADRLRGERTIGLVIRACDLEQAVMRTYLNGLIDARDVGDLFAEHGLEAD